MKRSPLARSSAPMRRTRLRPKRATPRRREAPRWTAEDWADAAYQIQLRSGSRCECCGAGESLTDPWERHHRQRRRDGGDRLSNLLLLRRFCHQFWTAHPAQAIARGIIVPTHADPAEVPVLHAGRDWSLLDDDGGRAICGLSPDYRIVP